MHVLKLRLAAARSDELSAELWSRLDGRLEGIEELPADGGALFRTGPEFEVLEFGSEAAIRCAKWLEDEKFRGGDRLIFQLYLSSPLADAELITLGDDLGAEVLSQIELPGVDYLEEYKRRVRGSLLAPGLWVGPSWDEPPAGTEHVFRVEPGLAFGTGEHPTTQLCLLRLLELSREGYAPSLVLDLGTGTGVLAAAVRRFFPRARLVVSDLDPACDAEVAKTFVANALDPASITGVYGPAGTAAGLRSLGLRFDFVVSNIYAEVLAAAAPDIYALCRPGSRWLASGILEGASESALDGATPPMFKDRLRRSRTLEQAQLQAESGLTKQRETWVLREWDAV